MFQPFQLIRIPCPVALGIYIQHGQHQGGHAEADHDGRKDQRLGQRIAANPRGRCEIGRRVARRDE